MAQHEHNGDWLQLHFGQAQLPLAKIWHTADVSSKGVAKNTIATMWKRGLQRREGVMGGCQAIVSQEKASELGFKKHWTETRAKFD